jgi:hypothetical protein
MVFDYRNDILKQNKAPIDGNSRTLRGSLSQTTGDPERFDYLVAIPLPREYSFFIMS